MSSPSTSTSSNVTGFDHLFKIVLVGDSSVGKSNLLSRYTRDVFTADDKSTIGVEFAARVIPMKDNKRVKAQIWDTAGQERYRAITTAYYRGALGALLVYDVTKANSLENIPRWMRELKDHANRDIVLLMVGNKTDMGDLRQVSLEQAQALAKELQIEVIEASAKDNVNVTDAFLHVVEKIYDHAKMHRGSIGGHLAPKTKVNTGFNQEGQGAAAGTVEISKQNAIAEEAPPTEGGVCCK